MRAVIQRVTSSIVSVDDEITGEIKKGLVVLLGVGPEDNDEDIEYLYNKIINLRIFEDENDKMNLSLMDIDGDILIVSQFTLFGDCRKGRRPNFTNAAPPDKAERLYNTFVIKCKDAGVNNVATGIFGAHMHLEINNDGPVTMLIDSKKIF